jgi:sugar phosphate isomerase/epimerase
MAGIASADRPAEPLGATVNHRPTAIHGRARDRAGYLLELADPRLKVCIDVGIWHSWTGPRPRSSDASANQLVHLKDWAFGKYCILGQGTKGIDWTAVLAAFTETGYGGWVTVELSSYGDTPADQSCVDNRAFLRSIGY